VNGRLVLVCATAAGILLLAYAAPRAHPAVQWNVKADRELSQARAREISAALGVDTTGWTATVTGGTNGTAGYFRDKHPEIVAAQRYSPVFAKVALTPRRGPDAIAVAVSATGDVESWVRYGFPKAKVLDQAAARRLAAAALTAFVGKDAGTFRPVPGAPEDQGALTIAFERATPPFSEHFEATVNGAQLTKVELNAEYGSAVDAALRARKKYINWLNGAAVVVVYFLGTILAAAAYVYWAVRRGIRHRFVFALSATAVVWGVIYWTNWQIYDQRFETLTHSATFWEGLGGSILVLTLLILLYVILVGAMDAVGPRAKLSTLRSLFSTSTFNRQAGASIFIGMLCGPLAAALPLAVSMLRLFGSERTGNYEASIIYASHLPVQALDIMVPLTLIGLFGFGAGQVARYIHKPWLSTAVLALVGTVLLCVSETPSETNPFATLLAAFLQFAVFYLLFVRVDVLAVLAAGWTAQVLWNASTLALQPAGSVHSAGVWAFVFTGGIAACAGLVALRGRAVALEAAAEPAVVTSRREALMQEFSVAHRVQQEMLPERPPEIAGCTLSASCQPAQDVGGDLFDFLRLPDGRWTIGVGDVSGKGVPAALYMTLTKGLLIATTQDSSDLLDIIGHVNRHIHAATERKTFVTMALGAFDPETGAFDHVRAGHNPIVWRRAGHGETSLLNSPGLGLGIVSDKLFRRSIKLHRLQLNSGDALVFYSDGLTEAMNADREQYGEERLMRSVEEADGLDAAGVRERIVASVTGFLDGVPPQDDMTIVVLRVN
jgi:serine phosphatase RsbU (regulator of sigma subunit)